MRKLARVVVVAVLSIAGLALAPACSRYSDADTFCDDYVTEGCCQDISEDCHVWQDDEHDWGCRCEDTGRVYFPPLP